MVICNYFALSGFIKSELNLPYEPMKNESNLGF